MKRLGWGVLTFLISAVLTLPVAAIDTVPTSPNKVTGPLLITGYSFSGPNLRYVQIYNNASTLVPLDGWQIISTTKATPAVTTTYVTMTGLLEPGKHLFAATGGIIDRASFTLPTFEPIGTPLVGTVSLVAPAESGFVNETVTVPTITTTMKEVGGMQTNYYAKRDVSLTTGNYVSGFSFMLPTEKLKNDQLYLAPSSPLLQIVEIYPDATSCSPFDTAATCTDYVKLFNASTTAIDLSGFRLRTGAYGQAVSSSNSRVMNGLLPSGHYMSFPLSLGSTGSWVWLEDAYGSVRYDTTMVAYPTNSGHDHHAWAYDEQSGDWRWTDTPSPADRPNVLPALASVNDCLGLTISEIAANVANQDQFIEIANVGMEPADMSGCVLQTNRSSSASYVFDGTLLPGSHAAVYVKDTPLTLTKTTSGTVYLLSSDRQAEVSTVEYDGLSDGTSYALIDGDWHQTFQRTPGMANVFMQYAPCGAGSVRNVESGLCNKVQAVVSDMSDCGEGKYRNVETNRCRSLATTASLLAPCAANQERNPDTNRCRAIASTTDELKPCAQNQERNPETNRCRTAVPSVAADFPVEAVVQGGQATLGWWAFGGVGTLAAGYAGWEWRREVAAWIKKFAPFGIGRS